MKMFLNNYLLGYQCFQENCQIWAKWRRINNGHQEEIFKNHLNHKCPECGSILIPFYDFYALFSVSGHLDHEFSPNKPFSNESITTIKENYKKLSMEFHPDLNQTLKANDFFSVVQNGFQTLMDEEKKKQYNADLIDYYQKEDQGEVVELFIEETLKYGEYENSPSNFDSTPDSSTSNSPSDPLSVSHSKILDFNKLSLKNSQLLNSFTGLILGLIGFILIQYSVMNTWISFFILIFFLTLSLIWKGFYEFIVSSIEFLGILIIFGFIFRENLWGAMMMTAGMIFYFSKIKKKLTRYLPQSE